MKEWIHSFTGTALFVLVIITGIALAVTLDDRSRYERNATHAAYVHELRLRALEAECTALKRQVSELEVLCGAYGHSEERQETP